MAKAKEENFVNNVIEVELSCGKFEIKEFSFKKIGVLIKSIGRVFNAIRVSGGENEDVDLGQFLLDNVDNENIVEALEDIIYAAIDRRKGEIELTLTDGLKVLDAISEVNDLELIRDLFFKQIQKLGGGITLEKQEAK